MPWALQLVKFYHNLRITLTYKNSKLYWKVSIRGSWLLLGNLFTIHSMRVLCTTIQNKAYVVHLGSFCVDTRYPSTALYISVRAAFIICCPFYPVCVSYVLGWSFNNDLLSVLHDYLICQCVCLSVCYFSIPHDLYRTVPDLSEKIHYWSLNH